MRKARFILLIIAIPLLLFHACEKNRGEIIPYVKVDIYMDIYAELGTLGHLQSKLISGGYNGIILYRESDFEFMAYDRTCTLFPDHDAAVIPDENIDGVFVCPECGSQYLVINGAQLIKGPAQYPLVEYRTAVTGSILHIFN